MLKRFIKSKFHESLMAVLPVFIVVLLISFFIDVPLDVITAFLIGTVLLVVGLTVFQIGANASMVTIAEGIGTYIAKKKS